jgi:nitrogen regulatory protein P-II 1
MSFSSREFSIPSPNPSNFSYRSTAVKKIEAIIRPYKVAAVKQALKNIGIAGMTLSKVEGIGKQKGHREVYRGLDIHVDSNPRTRIEIVVDDHVVGIVRDVILRQARTGDQGDGKIFIYNIEEAVGIRTGKAFANVSELLREAPKLPREAA